MSRYVIYEAIDKKIEFNSKGDLVSGICQDVKREVLDNKIIFVVNGQDYPFVEPHNIEIEQDRLIFVYGSEQEEDLIDFCGETYSLHWGEDVRKSIGREKSFLRLEVKVEGIGQNE